jgi:cell division protein ZapE
VRSSADDHSLRAIYERQIRERGFRSDPAQLAAVAALDDLRSRLIAAPNGTPSGASRLLSRLGIARPVEAERGLYLWGAVGRGKTWLMDLFFQSLPYERKRRRHFHRFMYDVHAHLKRLQDVQSPLEEVAEEIAADVRVICFDELFVTDIADAMILGTLFEGLFRRGVTLVATSNVPPRDLYKEGLQRARFLPAIDLIERNTQVLAVEGGTDYRLRQLTQAGTYLRSDAPDTLRRLEALFHELSDEGDADDPGNSSLGAHAGGDAVEIEGRPVPIVRERGTTIWFEFECLCEGPRSQNDYIQIAREYQSVIVANVPRLTYQRENAARRFIALVDELYDHNVNLILSAAAAPNDLYHGERLTFEFQRTVSRLIEMQTEEYLAREHRA